MGLAMALSLTAAACGAAPPAASARAPATKGPATTAHGSGPVAVLYAGSLVDLMEKGIGPAFDKATGYSFTGISGGSQELAAEIQGRVHQGDVFVSASPAVDAALGGSANGDWVSWSAQFATSPMVLGYNPSSSLAAAVKSQPWYQVLAQPGILVGRTDPATDPKGNLTVQALQGAASADNQPALAGVAAATGNVFPENTLVGRLQSGQLDVGFFYSAEAKAAGIPTVPLTGQSLQATYTVTVLDRAPDPAAAAAFVRFLLGPGGSSVLTGDGFVLTSPPTVDGTPPADLQGALGG